MLKSFSYLMCTQLRSFLQLFTEGDFIPVDVRFNKGERISKLLAHK